MRDVDSSGSSSRFRAARQVDSVAEEAVARHALADHARDDLAAMDPDGDLLTEREREKEREKTRRFRKKRKGQ